MTCKLKVHHSYRSIMVLLLHNLKNLRVGISSLYCSFASITKSVVVENLKPSHFTLPNQILCRNFTSEISENQHNFTVNYLVNSCGLSLENAISASKLLDLQTPEKADSVLALLRSHGFSQLQISKFVRSCPRTLLSCPQKTLLPKLEFFASVGVSREDLARTVAANPCLLNVSLEKRLVPTYNFLRSLLSEKNVIGVFKRRSWIFLVDHCKTVVPNIGLLRELGMPPPSISLLLAHYPHLTINKHERFRKIVGEVKEMGFSPQTSTFVFALHTLCGNGKLIWKRSRKIFMSWGWSEDDFLSAFRKNPEFTIVSEKKLVQVMDFLVNKMGWPSGMIARYPWVVRHSLEKRIRPRCLVVKVLRLKGLIDENLSLGYVIQPQDRLFLERFVTKFQTEVPQLWNVYQGKVGIEDV